MDTTVEFTRMNIYGPDVGAISVKNVFCKGDLMKSLVVLALAALLFTGCPSSRQVTKSDLEFRAALEESGKHKGDKIDFLADEVLPNEQIKPVDSSDVVMPVAVATPEYKEVKPARPAKYRVQVFAGSAENAQKNYDRLHADSAYGEVAMIHDTDDKWKVWVGGYETHAEATTAKQTLIDEGYPDAWVNEMKGVPLPIGLFWIQVGSFTAEASASALKNELSNTFKITGRVEKTDKAFKVWMGGVTTRSEAETLKQKLQSAGYPKAFLVESK